MKKTVISICLIFIAFSFLYSAEYQSTGIKIGVNFSNLKGGVWDNSGQVPGICYGLVSQFRMSEIVGLQCELLYTKKGATRYKYTHQGIFNYEYDLDYFEMPILLKYYIPVQEGINTHFLLGPAFCYNTFKHSRITNSHDATYESSDPAMDKFRSMDFGFVLGIGFDLYHFNFNMRYTSGFSSIIEDSSTPIRNRTITFSAGINIY